MKAETYSINIFFCSLWKIIHIILTIIDHCQISYTWLLLRQEMITNRLFTAILCPSCLCTILFINISTFNVFHSCCFQRMQNLLHIINSKVEIVDTPTISQSTIQNFYAFHTVSFLFSAFIFYCSSLLPHVRYPPGSPHRSLLNQLLRI